MVGILPGYAKLYEAPQAHYRDGALLWVVQVLQAKSKSMSLLDGSVKLLISRDAFPFHSSFQRSSRVKALSTTSSEIAIGAV